MRPPSGYSKPAINFRSVDFPDPEGPSSAIRLPVLISKLIWSSIKDLPNVLVKFSINILI